LSSAFPGQNPNKVRNYRIGFISIDPEISFLIIKTKSVVYDRVTPSAILYTCPTAKGESEKGEGE
jgi:hypothetical protein